MSIEMKDNPSSFHDIDTVEGVFLNAMICTLKASIDKSWRPPDGRLPEALTMSLMRIGHSFIRDMAMMMTLMEQDTMLHQQPDSEENRTSSVRRSEIHIAENVWAFVETMGTSSSPFHGSTQTVTPGALERGGLPLVSKDLCTLPDWLLITSILERPGIDSPSSNALYGLMQSVVDCYQQNSNL